MAIATAEVTVTTAATLITLGPRGGFLRQMWVEFENTGANTVYVGGAGVTSSTGRPVSAGESWGFNLGDSDDLYAITSAATSTVRWIAGQH